MGDILCENMNILIALGYALLPIALIAWITFWSNAGLDGRYNLQFCFVMALGFPISVLVFIATLFSV